MVGRIMSKTNKTTILVFNDTDKELIVRINIAGAMPTVAKVQPRKQIAVFMKSNKIFFKIWNDNVIMFQDRGGESES